eukprot:6173390-Pleurochrysis_carterae.AAC.2
MQQLFGHVDVGRALALGELLEERFRLRAVAVDQLGQERQVVRGNARARARNGRRLRSVVIERQAARAKL